MRLEFETKYSMSITIDNKTFHEGMDIAFKFGGVKFIGKIKQIIPALGNHPVALLLTDIEVYEGDKEKPYRLGVDTVRYFEIWKFDYVNYVSVD